MIIAMYLALIIGLSIYDIWNLKKKKLKKDLCAFIIGMTLVTALGVIYLSGFNKLNLACYIIELFNLKG